MAFGQKFLKAYVKESYNSQGVMNYKDSNVYSYSTYQGVLSQAEAQPQFIYIKNYFFQLTYQFDLPFIHCNQQQRFYGTSFPMQPDLITTNTIVNDQVAIAAEGNGYERMLYEYNSQGLLTKSIEEVYPNSPNGWYPLDSLVMTYDNIGNQLTQSQYNVTYLGPGWLVEVDSMFYETGTSNLTRAVNYNQSSNGTMEKEVELFVIYNGNNIQHVNMYDIALSGQLEYSGQRVFHYSGNALTHFTHIPAGTSQPNSHWTGFTYNSQGYPSGKTAFIDGDTSVHTSWEYDTDGYLKKQTVNHISPFGSYGMYKSYYYYRSVAGLNELEEVKVTVFPNPTSDIITVQAEGKIQSVSVYNSHGQLLLKQNTEKIDVSHLPEGNYILKGQTENGTFINQFIKK